MLSALALVPEPVEFDKQFAFLNREDD